MKAKEIASVLNSLLPVFIEAHDPRPLDRMAENASLLIDSDEKSIIIFIGNFNDCGKFEPVKLSNQDAPGSIILGSYDDSRTVINFSGMNNQEMKNRANQIINELQGIIDDIG